MKQKQYIRDNGKIRNCPANVAKMNVFEHSLYMIFSRNILYYTLKLHLRDMADAAKDLLAAICGILILPLFPIFIPIVSYFDIKKAKKRVENNNKFKN